MNTPSLAQTQFEPDFRLYLQSELTARCKKNPRYSLRAFAEFLQMDASSISQILSGKRKASTKVIEKIAEALGTHPQQKKLFIEQIKFKRAATPVGRAEYTFAMIAEDSFAFISKWYHYAILEFIGVDDFQPKPSWIARSLGISKVEAKEAIARMLRLGVLKIENGQMVKTHKNVTNFESGMTSDAHKTLQRDIISMAFSAIDNVPQEEKDITSMTMSIDIEKLPQARKLITKFRRDLCAYLEDGKQTRVYNLAIQLYPLSKKLSGQDGDDET